MVPPAIVAAVAELGDLVRKTEASAEELHRLANDLVVQSERDADRVNDLAVMIRGVDTTVRAPKAQVQRTTTAPAVQAAPSGAPSGAPRSDSLDKCQVALLTALAQHPDGLTKNKLGFLAGYNPTKSTIRTALGSLRTSGFVTPGGVETIRILPAGLEALGPFEELPRGRDLYEYWLGELDACQRALLEAFVAAYPDELPKEQIEPLTGYDPAKSTYRTAMGVLRRLDLVPRGQLRAADEFMQAIRG